jgi:ankyrin repeat protein
MEHLLGLTSIKQMKQALNSMPSNLAEAYESNLRRILEQSPSRANLAMRVIGWITHAERRLTAEELRHALAVEEHTSEIDVENLTLANVILQVCIGLVSVDPVDGTIGMIHITAYDYFRHLKERFSEIQLDIAKTCMLYLRFRPLCDGACSSIELLRNRFRDMPFLGYAAEHWGDHTRRVERDLSYQIILVLNDSGSCASAYQALHYHELRDPKLASATFDSLPTGLEPLHIAAYWNLSLTAESFLKDKTDPNMLDGQGWTALHWACSQGCEEMVALLLEYHADINARDRSGWTPLFWATIKDHEQIVIRLLRENANHLLIDSDSWTVLHWAASKGNTAITQILLNHHSKIKPRQRSVQIWIRDIHMERAKQLCNSSTHANKAPLEIAADRQDIHTFNTILEALAVDGSAQNFKVLWERKGFDEPHVSDPWRARGKAKPSRRLERRDIDGKLESSAAWKSKLLHGAIIDGKALIVQLLIELGTDLRSPNRGRTPLQQAAFLKDPEIAKILLANGADVSGITPEGQTALHLAVSCGFERTTEVLLWGGIDINSRNGDGKTPLMLACEASVKAKDPSLESVPITMVKMLIDHGADIHVTDRRYCNALHLAMQSHLPNIQIIKLLLQSGIDANLPDSQGYTPFHYFLKSFRMKEPVDLCHVEEIFELLLAHSTPGAENLEHRRMSCSGNHEYINTPLSLAIESDNWQTFHLLLAKGAILRTTQSLDGLLQKAACFRALQPKAVKILLAQGASVTIKRYGTTTPLGHIALEGLLHENVSAVSPFKDFKSILKMYMDAGLDINTTDGQNRSLLHVAAARANEPHETALVQHLIEEGADVYQSVCGAWDAFLLAAVHGKFSALRFLIAYATKTPNLKHWIHLGRLEHFDGDDDGVEIICASLTHNNLINSKDLQGLSPLQIAVKLRNPPTVSKLLSHGADLHVRDRYGWTVLHTATYNKDEAMVRLLLQAGSDVWATSQQWNDGACRSPLYQGVQWKGTPLHLAAMFGQPTIAELLLQHGADVQADSDLDNCSRGLGPTALHIALNTDTLYGSQNKLGPEMLKVAEILVKSGAKVEGIADHITLNDVLKFEGFEGLWEILRRGITGKGERIYVHTSACSVDKDPVGPSQSSSLVAGPTEANRAEEMRSGGGRSGHQSSQWVNKVKSIIGQVNLWRGDSDSGRTH